MAGLSKIGSHNVLLSITITQQNPKQANVVRIVEDETGPADLPLFPFLGDGKAKEEQEIVEE